MIPSKLGGKKADIGLEMALSIFNSISLAHVSPFLNMKIEFVVSYICVVL